MFASTSRFLLKLAAVGAQTRCLKSCAALLSLAIPGVSWADVNCEILVPPVVVAEGEWDDTYDPDNYRVGEMIREVRFVARQVGRYRCTGTLATGTSNFFGANTRVLGDFSVTKLGDMWVPHGQDDRGHGYRIFYRSPNGEMVEATSTPTSSGDHWSNNVKLDGTPFEPTVGGVVAVIRVYKIADTATTSFLSGNNFWRYDETVGEFNAGGACYFVGSTPHCVQSVQNTVPKRVRLRAADKPTCNIPVPNVDINGIRILLSQAQGGVYASRDFSININCSGGAVGETVSADFNMYDNNRQTGFSDQLTLSPGSTASGIAVEILRQDGTKVIFDKDGGYAWVHGQLRDGVTEVKFTANVVPKLGEDLAEGHFQAQATYTMTYH